MAKNCAPTSPPPSPSPSIKGNESNKSWGLGGEAQQEQRRKEGEWQKCEFPPPTLTNPSGAYLFDCHISPRGRECSHHEQDKQTSGRGII